MPTSAKRSQRTRRDTRRDTSPARIDDSSPTRPAKRRKKLDEAPPTEPADEDESSLTADQSGQPPSDDDQLLSQVVQHLQVPSIKEGPVQASKDHANSIHEANKNGVQAYAKIAAQDWTFYVTKLIVNIGRSSEGVSEDDEDFIHIDLGPSKMVSRQHARIYFSSKDEIWFLEVKGRNGVKANGVPLKPGSSRRLESGEVLDIGGTEMMFVLPTEISPLHIDPLFLKRAGLSRQNVTSPPQPRTDLPDEPSSALGSAIRSSRGQQFRQPIAPAPADYKRPGTPPSVLRGKPTPTQHKSPHYSSSGTLLLNSNDIDLSLDENKHIKPQYSYAQMITQAIINTPEGKLNLNGIYNFIMTNYAYYRNQQAAGWQNSIRHNLSLNKAFDKVARSTDEPGKGMKWQIVPEAREEMTRTAYKGGRGGHRGSSAPSSPSQLNYITHGPRDVTAREPASVRKRKVSSTGSPPPSSSLAVAQSTPDRSTRRLAPPSTALTVDGSPLPRPRKGAASASASASFTSTSYNDQSPTLTSSYLPEEGASFVTPAPHRVHPHLAPPSTAQRPSQHMPTSSPAPFWRYADIGSTPLKPAAQFDMSPSKPSLGGIPQSSSPPPAKSPNLSPTRSQVKESSRETPSEPPNPPDIEEEQGFDLARGFQSIGSYHAPVSRGISVASAMNGHS
ncbi:Fork-head transcriptional regulator 2 [Colletotrichum chlorophyti]|uniref:Fork-head transcriptional regulator 2 n=1 Tax=Colletotrichum chlorophyti TaxID=708187 RepID=A0A1Q8RBN2_9PEZI|nr:Fork-head transcriptional regulator 2 [Colletotrichum chlorophyti]